MTLSSKGLTGLRCILSGALAAVAISATAATAKDIQSIAALPAAKGVAMAATDRAINVAQLRQLLGAPSFARGGPGCGDGLPGVGEECDDGNLTNGDGCSDVCTVEVPFACTGASGTSSVADPGFELGSGGPWTETATDTLDPICTAADCQPLLAGIEIEGSHFLWFGAGNTGVASVSQDLTIPVGSSLSFWALRGICDSVGTDDVVADIDGTAIITVACDDPAGDDDWVFYESAIGAILADGGVHTLTITGTTTATDTGIPDFTNVFVDFVNVGPVTSEPSVCTSACGNGLPDGTEQCDDGNTAGGDGCSASCEIEDGFECTAAMNAMAIDAVNDPSFELGPAGGVWTQTFPATAIEPIDAQPTANTGDFIAWFGGIPDTMGVVNVASVSQTVTIPAGGDTLTYFVARQICDPSGLDTLTVRLGGNVIDTLDCPMDHPFFEPYMQYTVDLSTAAGGPYNDGGSYLLEVEASTRGSDTNDPVIGLWTNYFVDDVSILTGEFTDPVASMCTPLPETCYLEDFDEAGAGDLSSWTLFNDGAQAADWGTTDDGVCGAGNVGPGNFSGGTGEAACIDSDSLSSGAINAYLCSPEIALNGTGSTLDFLYNYHPFQAPGPDDAFEVLVGTDAPGLGTIGGYTSVFFTNTDQGTLIGLPGDSESLDLSAFEGSSVHVCFRYGGDFDWYAHVDDVAVNAVSCGAADTDGDGVTDDVDNCIERANPLQIDSNGDDIGNVCDADIAGPAGPGADDCNVNFFDLGRMKAVFFGSDPDADLVGLGGAEPDGVVNFFDLGRMKELFFAPPGPSANGCN